MTGLGTSRQITTTAARHPSSFLLVGVVLAAAELELEVVVVEEEARAKAAPGVDVSTILVRQAIKHVVKQSGSPAKVVIDIVVQLSPKVSRARQAGSIAVNSKKDYKST